MKPMPAVPMPLTLGDLWRASRTVNARARLEEQIADYHGAHAAFGVSTGRAALWLILRALSVWRPERHLVIVPGYTCPTIGRSVVEAGLRCLCADVSEDTFNIDPTAVAAVIDERVLAVVAPHMFGLPCDLTALELTCREYDAFLIEDCAQCVGGTWAGGTVGSIGDAGFLSMGRSKNLRGYEGGLLWTKREELVDPLSEMFQRLPKPAAGSTDWLRQAAITVLSQPRAWALAKRFPGLRVGAEDADFDPHPSKLADWQAGLGLISLTRLEDCNARRREAAQLMREALREVDGLQCQACPPEAVATYLRFATRLTDHDAGRRSALVDALQAANIDARAFYTKIMSEYDWMQCEDAGGRGEGARAVVSSNLILPMPHDIGEAELMTMGRHLAPETNGLP